ncbi:hypothetical protein HID58_024628 [Brassica napus]|uniref:Uncharacterized protein n=1 Tax=Brassica napus TaxID=3708 RepID=A0ABQ8CIW0_BRANA|nr:hypothetical protein HID58_024628 [Brassica napus]
METAAAVTSESEKLRLVLTPEQTVSQRSGVRRVDLMRSKASFLQTADAGDATISSTAELAITEKSRPFVVSKKPDGLYPVVSGTGNVAKVVSRKSNMITFLIARSVTMDMRLQSYVARGEVAWLRGLFAEERLTC